MRRPKKRTHDQIRPLHITTGIMEYPDGSVLLELGKTKVLCAVSLTHGVPLFLRNKKKWWLTASYALLPTSTQSRSERESIVKRNDRSVEISRLIGRALRSVLNLHDKSIEKTIHIDCDVIQADGGTRTACITGAFVALKIAEQRWLQSGLITEPMITDELAAISVGINDGIPLLDLDFAEDSTVQADFNFVLTRSGCIVEIQGSAEQKPIAAEQFNTMKILAYQGIQQIFSFLDKDLITHSATHQVLLN
jgi:ribonuclease PH